ncbi:MAG: hypothetical protein Q7T57_02490, partial [Dehalococcoidales bacterium]|nr:hypothetical protein [Dehalococcoidales bacterium]
MDFATEQDLAAVIAGGATTATTPAKDTLVSMAWTAPVDREKLPNDRLLVSTRAGFVYTLTAPNIYHDAPELKLAPEFVQAVATKLDSPITSLQANLSDRTVIYATTESKLLCVYSLQYDSTLQLTQTYNSDVPADDVEEVGADGLVHQRPASVIAQALTGNLLVTSGADGIIVLRDGESLEYLTRFPIHDYIVGGTCSISISPDSSLLVTSGFDGSLMVFDLSPLAPAISTRRSRKLRNLPQLISAKVLEQLNEVAESEGEHEVGYVQMTSGRTKEGKTMDLQQKILKDELQKSLYTFKLQFNEILHRNANLPELERLGYADFAIDLELKDFLTREGEKRIDAIREQIHSECVGKEYIIERIRQQCWNAMEVKGAMFTAFRSEHEVHNYPVRALTAKESRRIKQVQFLRRMEIVEGRWRHNQQLKADENDVHDRNFHPQKFTEESGAYLMNMELEEVRGE